MNQSIEKKEIRKQMLKKRRELDEAFIEESQQGFLQMIEKLPAYQDAKRIMLYIDFQKEAPTKALVNEALFKNKTVILPLTDENFTILPYRLTSMKELVSSPLGILEPDPHKCHPADPKEIDLILIPGVAFDHTGNRIGFGKGCYDAFLPKLRFDVLKIGFAYDFQLLERIPFEVSDIPVDFVLTEKQIFKTFRP